MKRLIFLLILLFIASCTHNYKLNCDSTYKLVWSDEFQSTELDSTKWDIGLGGQYHSPGSLNTYTADNVFVYPDYLDITANKIENGYTAALVYSKDTWTYGKIEAKIKLPYGQGIWPAFWMITRDLWVGNGPLGEIDILEMIGGSGDNKIYGTAHWVEDSKHKSSGESYTLSQGRFTDDYHIFGICWNKDFIQWYVDGNIYYQYQIGKVAQTIFSQPFIVILNIAVGGDWPGSPDTTTIFPQSMKVDWVRIYQQ